jgi:hypothetical protein
MKDLALRSAAGLIAGLAWTAEILFMWEQLSEGSSLPDVVWQTSSFLTDLSATLVAIVCTLIAIIGPARVSPFWRTAATMATALVGIMFAGIGGLEVVFGQGASSILAHLVIPLMMTLYWLTLPHGGLGWRRALGLIGLVFGYFLVTFARGALGDGYPYPFIDVERVGWSSALTFSAIVMIVGAVISLVLIGIDRWIAKRNTATRLRSGL